MKCRHVIAGIVLTAILGAALPASAAADEIAAPSAAAAASQADEPLTLIPLGVFTTTGYCPCGSCSGRWGRLTSTGALAAAGHTVAVDPRVIPYGARLMINGVIYTAEDRGGGVRGNHIDIFYDTHEESRLHGAQAAEGLSDTAVANNAAKRAYARFFPAARTAFPYAAVSGAGLCLSVPLSRGAPSHWPDTSRSSVPS